MIEGCENRLAEPGLTRAPRIAYRSSNAAALLAEPGTLAVFGFGGHAADIDDPRWLRVPLEAWQVDGPVQHGRHGALRWSAGGGWLYAALELDEREHGGPAGAARV